MIEPYPVSVIIPAHNAVQTVKRAIDSAFNADAGEVVVVDDGSTDGTIEMLSKLESSNYSKLKIISTGSLVPAGVGHARNLGISSAKYDFIVPLDADDALMPEGIGELCGTYECCQVVYGGHIKEDTGEFVQAPPRHRLSQKNLTGATFSFWRDDWARVGGYHPDFNIGCEDWALMCALVNGQCRLLGIIDKPIYIYSPGGKRAARCFQYADTIRKLLAEHYPAVFNAQQSG